MIKYKGLKYRKFINFINKELPTFNIIKLKLLKGYDTIEVNKTDKVFALYYVEEKAIYLPTSNEEEITYTNLAHEYVHAWQDENNKDFSEEEAELKASELYNKFKIR
jgi:Zn-dependent peptidase ImmA (M78 family)